MKKIFTFAAALLFGMSMMAQMTTLVDYNISSTDQAQTDITSGDATIYYGATGKFETKNSIYGYKLDGDYSATGTKYVKVTLGTALAEGDIITLRGFTPSGPGTGYQFQLTGNRAETADVWIDNLQPAAKNNIEELTYTVVGTAIGATEFYVWRHGSSVYFTGIKVEHNGVIATKFTVTYMDGETILGTERVNEGETATKASNYEAKTHATFNGWFEDATLTVPADFTAAITADKTFYGKWTADAFTASTSLNIEQGVLDNSTKWDIASALTAAHITYANINALDSLNDDPSKTNRNEPFLGLKLKTTGAYVEVGLNAGDVLKVKFGNVGADVKINGVTVAKADLATPYEYTATEQGYVRIETTSSSTVVLKQIMINEDIANVVLPEPIATSINNVEAAKAIKVIENGQIVIIKNGVRYNAVGAKL